jgi:hypothetical protein
MSLKYLLDEHVAPALAAAIRNLEPEIDVRNVGDSTAPPRGTLDPEILQWCETEKFVLLSNDRSTLPVHVSDHVAQGGRLPGVFLLNTRWTLSQTAEHLVFVALVSFNDEYENQVRHLPIV